MTVGAVASFASTIQGAPAEEALVAGSAAWEQHVPATAVDGKDTDTPDDWIPRDPRLQRLTGRWACVLAVPAGPAAAPWQTPHIFQG